MAPQSTWLSALALLPPLSVFLAVLTLDWRERRLLSLLTIAFAVASAFLGLAQLVEGPTSPLRFFAFTNANSPVGFFANVNHFAALLYCAILLAAAWGATAIDARRHSGRRGRDDAASIMAAVAASVALLILICVVVMARSRAGLILTLVGLCGALTLTAAPLREFKNLASVRAVIGVIAVALLFLGRSALSGALDRFGVNPLGDARAVFARVTIEAAKALMPVGAGAGAFVPAYAMFEKPEDLITGVYANHAHNDLLELWLETGVAGPLLLALLLYWLARKAAWAWGPSNPGPLAIDRSLLRAAVVIIALLLCHSLVDYPLRTGAMMAIMGFACALLIDPVAPAVKAAAPPPNEAAARRSAAPTSLSPGGPRRRHGPSRRDRVS
jgi:O-antigen ligase